MNPELTGHFWYRESTQEWVFEVEFQIEGFLISICRYTGKTKMDALKNYMELFQECMGGDIQELEKSGYVGEDT